jgi:ribonuclease-3
VDDPTTESHAEAEPALDSLQASLGHRFQDLGLLTLALSVLKQPLTPETAAARQRLEFLGDAAWNFALATAGYQAYPHAAPGDLTRLRAAWSSRTGLARLAKGLGLPLPSIAPPGPSQRVLAELLEAVLGAIVEDGGLDAVRTLAIRVVAQTGEAANHPILDPKSALQMMALSHREKLPAYRLLDKRGPAHHPTFRVAVTVCGPGGEIRTEAEGSSRQAAEQEAARLALATLGEQSLPATTSRSADLR